MAAYPLNTDDFDGELFNLAMFYSTRSLLEDVKSFLASDVIPMEDRFYALWSLTR